MTTLILLLSLFGPIDRERFLDVLAQVESGNNPRAVGKAGEVGRHQISRIAFRDVRSASPETAARLILDKNIKLMSKAGVPITPANLALAHHRGFTGAKRRKWRADDHAIRTERIYNSTQAAAKHTQAAMSPHPPVARPASLSKAMKSK